MVDGTARDYIVKLPDAYDPATAYRLVFTFHGRTGTAEQIATGFGGGYYGLEQRIGDSTILVSPQGLGTEEDPADTGWPNTGGRDIAFVQAMLDSLTSSYCVDTARIFTTGMSYGGIMSNTIGCEMPDVFRGLASIAGAMFGRNGCDGPPIATWMTHGTADDVVTYESGETARDNFLEQNHCDTTIEPVATEPEGCVEYQGCDAGFPVIWCTHDGGHTIPSYSGQAISDFFAQF
jgi:poly(3-hydroxybutyrate) depolymerase